jgi:hypothetical protein
LLSGALVADRYRIIREVRMARQVSHQSGTPAKRSSMVKDLGPLVEA